MDAVIPCARLEALVAPHYPTALRGCRPLPLATMPRVYIPRRWFDVSDPQADDMPCDSEAMRRFAHVPDESTILCFRHLLTQQQLTARMLAAETTLLEEKRLRSKVGTIVDGTIIGAPSSTKNATQTGDPEMSRTRKGNQW